MLPYDPDLPKRLQEAEDIIEAIRDGRIDALVVYGGGKESVFTLKGADQTYRMLIETMSEGAVILSTEGTILYCNRQFAQMLKTPIHHVTGACIIQFIAPQDHDYFRDLCTQGLAEDGVKAEMTLEPVKGHAMRVLFSLRPFNHNDLKAFCLIVTDLTQQKKTEDTLRKYSETLFIKNAELKKRAEQLSRLSAELTMTEKRERAKMSKILHDGLQQMLASAKLQLGCMLQQLPKGEPKQLAGEVESILSESIEISRSLCLDLSPPVLHEGGLAAGLEWLARSMREKHLFNVELRLNQVAPLPEDVIVFVFESVRELVFNAVKHARVQSARVSVDRDDQDNLIVKVTDEGVGFDLPHLETAVRNGGGYGLFSIRERLALIDGCLSIESIPGRGSDFTMIIPLLKQAASDTAEANNPLGAGDADAFQGLKTKVLIADDHTLFRDGLVRFLSREPDIEVAGQATNGREAIDAARKHKPHVILMDIGMPVINGIEATAVIAREMPEIGIIGLTMHVDPDNAKLMRQAGSFGYLNKTCSPAELLSVVRSVRSRHVQDSLAIASRFRA